MIRGLPSTHLGVRMASLMPLRKTSAAILFVVMSSVIVSGQTSDKQNAPPKEQRSLDSESSSKTNKPPCTGAQGDSQTAGPIQAPAKSTEGQKSGEVFGQQTKRIFGIVPNFSAVNANTQLPPLTVKGKFDLALHDSVDYSSFIWAGVLAGQNMLLNADPELHHGPAGYGRYYWRAFADQASGAFFTEAIVPSITHDDPRYYTLGQGSFLTRTGYALSQIVLTKKDSGRVGFNYSELFGNGLEAGVANLYYPPQERGLRKTGENWLEGLESAALNNIVKEFWPDIRKMIFRQK